MTSVGDAEIIQALAHPLRVKVIAHLCDEEMASPSELALRFDTSLGAMSYHVRRLHSLGLLRLVRRTAKRGAVAHHYALTPGIGSRFSGVAASLIATERRSQSAIGA